MSITTTVPLLERRRTKIVATIGPASSSAVAIRSLLLAGVNVIRLNMSHGEHAAHAQTYSLVRQIAAELGVPLAIFADLCGPKIRVGKLHGGQIELKYGSNITVTTRDVQGNADLIPSQYRALAQDVKTGDHILLNDGALELQVEQVAGTEITCRVIHGGILKDHKGINLPRVNVSAPSLTEKDRVDAQFALDLGVDYLALSFVRRAADIEDLRQLIDQHQNRAGIIAKIEKPEALDNAEAIIEKAGAIMVARGDLGVELNAEQVPLAQAQLIELARAANRPVIVATQMLESMIENARPTRAEVTDVSHAVAAGADAVMLSGETAVGAHAVAAVEMMARIAKQTEAQQFWQRKQKPHNVRDAHRFGDAVAEAAAKLTYDMNARGIVVHSRSGMSAVTVSSARPWAPIIGITADARTYQRMSLMWGVVPLLVSESAQQDLPALTRQTVTALKLAGTGDYVLLVQGFHSNPQLNAPTITLLTI